jgi:hypothetical protein
VILFSSPELAASIRLVLSSLIVSHTGLSDRHWYPLHGTAPGFILFEEFCSGETDGKQRKDTFVVEDKELLQRGYGIMITTPFRSSHCCTRTEYIFLYPSDCRLSSFPSGEDIPLKLERAFVVRFTSSTPSGRYGTGL